MRVVLEPVPRGGNDRVDLRVVCRPAQLAADLARIGVEHRGVAGAAGTVLDRYLEARHPAGRVEHLTHGVAPADPEVVEPAVAGTEALAWQRCARRRGPPRGCNRECTFRQAWHSPCRIP